MLASNGSENDAREGAAENCPENASVLEQHKSKRVCVDCKANDEENTRKLDALGKRMDQMDKKLDLIINLLGEEDVPDTIVIKGEEKIVHKHVEAQVNVDVWKGEEKGVWEHFEAQVHVDVRSDDEANIPAEKVEDKCNTNLENTSPMVDMHNKGVSPSNNTDRSIIVYEKPPPNVPKRRPKKAAALKSLYTDTQHIDSALYWIRKVKFESPTAQMENCTTTDVLFQQHLDARFQRFIKEEGFFFENDKLLEYCIGASPCLGNPWIGVDKVLAEIDFIARKITVYDSETYFIGGRKFERFMEPLSTLLPLLLQKIGFFSKRPMIEHGEDMTPWSVERCELVPQQEKSDCRVFVIKFVEHLIHGESIDSVQADKVKYFRTYLCLNLWRSRIALW
ncbi:hypothetical protein Dsin_026782 [Dipteronia sinensis]|uniref:Ubiquitin-like protease family profile domain-containing protein n=1 Tax=Dipteronia sinensis TaxID=43782 RepID=A0AAD9ZYB0_9ROSI|nr:hypothetical protein Dsin_026782 [Dipteronia sinensis]